jgi:membrane protease YdiL (CAAX protease family)
MNAFPWNTFFILLATGLICTACVIPYSLSMNPKATEALKRTGETEPGAKKLPPMPVLILSTALQSIILIGAALFVGLLASREVGLGTPILQAALEGGPVMDRILEMLPASLLLGAAAGIVMMFLEGAYFMQRIPRELANLDHRTAFWKRVLACFYGGIVEEILLRLFVMGGLAWLLGRFWQTPDGAPAMGAFWAANLLAALLFGAGHLPATAQITRLTPMVVARGLVLNGIPGVTCGYLFMAYGLEAAMVSHFFLDIVIHLMAPPVMRKRAEVVHPEHAALTF